MFAIQPIQNDDLVREPDWQELARCNDGTGSMTELFFSEQLDDIAAAKAFCLECPVKETCLEGARERREPWGVWGGELFVNGKIVAQKRKRGRPRKVRPEVDVPEAQSAGSARWCSAGASRDNEMRAASPRRSRMRVPACERHPARLPARPGLAGRCGATVPACRCDESFKESLR